MTTLRQAAEQALKALEKCDYALAEELAAWDINPPLHHVLDASNACGSAVTALREALAQREWVGLANEEVKKEVEIEMKYYWDGDYIDSACACEQLNNFARTIESKLKEKNT